MHKNFIEYFESRRAVEQHGQNIAPIDLRSAPLACGASAALFLTMWLASHALSAWLYPTP
jgi:hypothetical protein